MQCLKELKIQKQLLGWERIQICITWLDNVTKVIFIKYEYTSAWSLKSEIFVWRELYCWSCFLKLSIPKLAYL